MEFLICNSEKMEESYLTGYTSLDIEVNTLDTTVNTDAGDEESQDEVIAGSDDDSDTENTFELRYASDLPQDNIFFKYLICPGTEWGGIIDDITTNTKSTEVSVRGLTWRGLLKKDIISPPSGQGYRFVTGDANDILRTLLALDGGQGSRFTVPDKKAGISFTNYKIDRYVTKQYGIEKMLGSKGYKLKIWVDQGGANEEFKVMAEAVPIEDYSGPIEYSQDTMGNVTIADYRGGINHLIALGRGQLASRVVLHFYVTESGKITQTKPQYLINDPQRMRTAIYEYSNSDEEGSTDNKELIKGAQDRFVEIMDKKTATIDEYDDASIDLADIVGVRDRQSKLLMAQPIVGKILKSEREGIYTTTMKVKGSEDE